MFTKVTDVSGQKALRVEIPDDARIDEVVQRLLEPLNAPRVIDGRPVAYGVRSEKLGRFLNSNERATDAIEPDDTLKLMPSVEAG